MIGMIKRSLLLGALLLSGTAYSQNYSYLDDANERSDGPSFYGDYPKVMATETQSDDASNEAWSKYDLLGTKTGMMYRVAAAQAINPNLEFHYSFHPGEYLGYLSADPCDIAFGMPFNSTASSTSGCSVYAGHWLYRAGTQLSYSINSSTNTLRVSDANRLAVGSYAVIYDSPAGSFNNPEHVKITGIDKSVTPHRVTISSRGYKSVARTHAANSIVAAHVQGSGGSANNWAFNISVTGKRDSRNKTIAEVMVDWIPNNMNRNAKGQALNVDVAGVYFDQDYYVLTDENTDVNNDLVPDKGFLANGYNSYGEGLEMFYQLLRNRLPAHRIVGGWRQTRGFASLNGVQMENWLLAGNDFAVDPDYTGNGGIYSQLHNYMIHLSQHDTAEGYTETLSKIPTKLYPGTVKSGPNPTVPANNANFRLGLGATLLGDGHYGRQNSDLHPDPWYDEYAVDVKPGSPKYGQAIASNRQDESQIRAHKGWLGKPLGKRKRIYNSEAFSASRNLISNGGFESGMAGWQLHNVNATLDSGVKKVGQTSLKTTGHKTYAKSVGGASVRGPLINMVAGRTYTLAFAAKSSKMRQMYLRLDWSEHQGDYLVPTDWARFVWTMTAKNTGSFRPVFNLGQEDTTVWIDDVYVFEGDPNIFRRDFENGIVVVNATPKSQTVDLGGTFQRITGTGQDPINNGATLTTVTIPKFDAAILVRPEHEDSPAPPAGGNGSVLIAGQAWKDIDADGIRDSGEEPYGGIKVTLQNCANYTYTEMTTASNGTYLFNGLQPGKYTVFVGFDNIPTGAQFSPPHVGAGNRDSDIAQWPGQTYCMQLGDGDAPMAVDVGIVPSPSAPPETTPPPAGNNDSIIIGGRVWWDANADGIRGGNEGDFSGLRVQLRNCVGYTYAETTSNSNGRYAFTGLEPGGYMVRVNRADLPSGAGFSPSHVGAGNEDSDIVLGTGQTHCMQLTGGDMPLAIDIGLVN